MPVTLIVEPDNGGHRFQAAANVARVAARTGEVVLLTSRGAAASDEFATYLSDAPVTVEERFDEIHPPTREMARAVADWARRADVDQALVMDADQSLKRWWYVAAKEFRGLARRPRVVFMLTRYPATLALNDRFGWKLRVSKALLALAAMVTRTVHRVAGFAGRDDMSKGWIVKRARDPAICSAHSRDRARIREEFGLPADRKLVGIFGVITERKKIPFTVDAMTRARDDADLVVAGLIEPDVAAWIEAQPPDVRRRIVTRHGFLPNDELDKLVAACDVCVIALTNNGPSGIMGKALAAGVPVVSAGSQVRARELEATGGGVATELTVEGVSDGLRRVLGGEVTVTGGRVPVATADEFASVLLGVPYARG